MMLYPSHNVTLNVILMPLFLNGVSNDDHNKKKESFGFRRFVLFVFVSHLPFNLFVSVNKLRRWMVAIIIDKNRNEGKTQPNTIKHTARGY